MFKRSCYQNEKNGNDERRTFIKGQFSERLHARFKVIQ